ncbi:hypothetical protein K8T06_00965 [bacterium]|nr:hypothetical protein [bacterium]
MSLKTIGTAMFTAVVVCLMITNGFAETNHFYDRYDRSNPVVLSGLFFWDCFLRNVVDQSIQQRLPGSWNLDEMINLAAGIPVNKESHVHGAAVNDNLYLIDGLDHTDILLADGRLGLMPEVVDSIEIQTGALNAEYGRVMGGVFNAITRSGGDDLHGRIRLDYVDTDWIDDLKDSGYYTNYPIGDDYSYWKPTLVLEGPIIIKKLWFLAAYSYYQHETPITMIDFYGADYLKREQLYRGDKKSVDHHAILKLTFQPSNSHRFDVTYYIENTCRDFVSGDYADTREARLDQESGYVAMSLDWKWLFSEDIVFKLKIGHVINELDMLPDNKNDNPRDAAFYDTFHQQGYNNGSSWSEDDRERFQLKAEADWNVEDLFGKHRFKSGIELQKHSYDFLNKYPGGASYTITQIPVGDPNAPDYYYGYEATRKILLHPGTAGLSADYLGFFIQDDWLVTERIKLDLGFRYEWMEYQEDSGSTDVPAWTWGDFQADTWLNPDGSSKQTAPMRFDDMFAPRLRISWDVFGNESTVFNGFYGRYYNPFDLYLPKMLQSFSADNISTRTQEYMGSEWHDRDKDGVPDEDHFFDEANWETQPPEPPFTNLIDPDLKAEYTDEIIVGVQQKILDNLTVSLNFIHRESENLIEDVGLFMDDDGNIVWTYLGAINDDFTGLKPSWNFDPRDDGRDFAKHIYYITNVKGNDREYNGLELSVLSRNDNWDLQLFYTLSKAEGSTIEGHEGYDRINQFSGQYDTVQTSQNLFGELPWSNRHNLRIAGAYWFNITDWYEMSFGVNAFYNSGYHYSKCWKPADTYDPDDATNDFNDPNTWSGRSPYRSYSWVFPNGRGQHVFQDYYRIDLSWQNTFDIGRYGKVTAIFDVQNINDKQKFVTYTDTYWPGNDSFVMIGPREYRLSLKYSF